MTRAEAARRVAPLFARAFARLDLDLVDGVAVPAPVNRRPDVATPPPVAAQGTAVQNGDPVHGARVDPTSARSRTTQTGPALTRRTGPPKRGRFLFENPAPAVLSSWDSTGTRCR